jgi:integrase
LRVSTWRRRFWAPAVEKAGLEWCTPHSLRHSQVALLIEAGEQPSTIAKRLGLTSVKTVLDVYGHLYEGADQAAADKLDEAFHYTKRAPEPPSNVVPLRKKASDQGK